MAMMMVMMIESQSNIDRKAIGHLSPSRPAPSRPFNPPGPVGKVPKNSNSCSKWLRIVQNYVLLLSPLYPFISASKALPRMPNDRYSRDVVAKNLDFAPCGSVFDIFSANRHRKSIENLSQICWKSNQHLFTIYRTSIENLSHIFRASIE